MPNPPDATRVLLLRHAETAAPQYFHGAESDVELGPRGMAQAAAIAEALRDFRPTALYSSAMTRAVQTAAPIGIACGLSLRVEPELHERRMGPYSGVLIEERRDAYLEARASWKSGDLDYSHEGGESYRSIRDRALPVFERVVAEHPGETIVVVCHGVVIRVLITSLVEGYGPERFDEIPIENVAVNDLRLLEARWSAAALSKRLIPDHLVD